MKYTKQPLSITEQIRKLKGRGLVINDKICAEKFLSNVSYYRLRAYTYPFQDNINKTNDHYFLRPDIQFSDIIDLYTFDSCLRKLVFNAIEAIEISVRTQIIYEYSIATNDSHWFMDKSLYHYTDKYEFIMNKIKEDIARSNEDFVSHYKNTYDDPELPPAWMTLETLSFGNLSKLFKNLERKYPVTKNILHFYGLPNLTFLMNWMHTISALRNYCAHHSRIWNRRFPIGIKLPYNAVYPFMERKDLRSVRNNKLFALVSCIKYILNIICPDNKFKDSLLKIVSDGGKLVALKDMGFPENWQSFGAWKS
jgi:abortive infection bacteriophage resistance protein